MRRIHGRVLVRETNLGIENLLVTAYDAAVETAAMLLEAAASPKGKEAFGRRIASVVTDGNGAFELTADDLHFSGNEPRPNLLLVIFAPEDVQSAERPFPLPPERRILYLSAVPRTDAGAEEAFVIRLLQKQLEHFSITAGGIASKSDVAVSRLQEGGRQALELRDGLKEKMGPQLRREQQRVDKIRKAAKEKVQALSGIPRHLRDGELRNNKLLIQHRRDLAAKLKPLQDQAIHAGLARLKKLKPTLRLSLTSEDLQKLGLRQEGDRLVGNVDVKELIVKARSLNGGHDLVRRRSPNNQLIDALERRYLSSAVDGVEAELPFSEDPSQEE